MLVRQPQSHGNQEGSAVNVGQLRQAIANLSDDLPVVIDQEDLDLVGEYVEVMQVRFTDSDVYFDPKGFSLDGSRPYDRADWHNTGTPAREKPTEPVVLLGCRLPWQPTIDAEIVQPELESRKGEQ